MTDILPQKLSRRLPHAHLVGVVSIRRAPALGTRRPDQRNAFAMARSSPKFGSGDNDAVNLLAVGIEEFGTKLCLLKTLDAAEAPWP